jgi:hypothetical protein
LKPRRGWESKRLKRKAKDTHTHREVGEKKAESDSDTPGDQASKQEARPRAQLSHTEQVIKREDDGEEAKKPQQQQQQRTRDGRCLGRLKRQEASRGEMAMESKVLDCWWLNL